MESLEIERFSLWTRERGSGRPEPEKKDPMRILGSSFEEERTGKEEGPMMVGKEEERVIFPPLLKS